MDKSNLKKAMIFDLDGTLWEGVFGEEIGNVNYEIVNNLIFLARHGVIIGLCSKNDWAVVDSMLRDKLKILEYVSVYRVNWKDKVSNLKEIAEELNIGLDAMVMVDDNPYEREMISEMLPVMTIHPMDIMHTVAKWFDLSGDMTKTQQYKENYQRTKYQEQFTDISEYLSNLEMVLSIKIDEKESIHRIAELTQKTNQFNLTTMRLTEAQIEAMMIFPCRVYSLHVRDRFGDSGLTGVCVIRGNTIQVFLLSCRILGRGIEFAFMDFIMANCAKSNFGAILGPYYPTDKNSQVKDFYEKCGFNKIHEEEEFTVFSATVSEYKPVAAKYFKYE